METNNQLGEKIREYYNLSVLEDVAVFFENFNLTDTELEFLEYIFFSWVCRFPIQTDTSVKWVAAVEHCCVNFETEKEELNQILESLLLDLDKTIEVWGMLSNKSTKIVDEILKSFAQFGRVSK